jgi:NADPH:quinone reductase-like Zn-dependent oxidoreductase
MQTVIFNKAGVWTENLQLANIQISDPSQNEVQVSVRARPITPSNEMFIKVVYRHKPTFPQIAGLEGAGVISKIGKNIDNALLGQHVAFRTKGTWAEKINLTQNDFRIIPKEIPFEIGSQLSLNTLSAYALLEMSAVASNQWLLLTAANSSLCKQIIQLAKAKQIRIIALVRKEDYKNELLNLGADLVLNSERENLEKPILDLTGNGANAILDAVGGSLGTAMFNVAAPFSKIIIYGRLSNENTSFSYGTVIYKNLKIEGFGIDNWLKNKSEKELNYIWEELTRAVINTTLQLHYDKTFELKDFKEAILYYKQTGNKVILK